METLNVNFDVFKISFSTTANVYSVTSTQWIDGSSKRVVDLYAVKSGYLMQCSILENEIDDYALINNTEMGDGVTENAIANAIAVGL
jgi:hypothetical protein